MRVAPARYTMFAGLLVAAGGLALVRLPWREALLVGFDVAALAFFVSLVPLLREGDPDAMRARARRNDVSRTGLLAVCTTISLVVLVTVGSLVADRGGLDGLIAPLVVATLVIAWTFANAIFALHYAHLYYDEPEGGLSVPHTKEPDYRDFAYFAFTLGMTFQTSDVDVTDRGVRGVALGHSLAAFLFNLGILAFVINVLGG